MFARKRSGPTLSREIGSWSVAQQVAEIARIDTLSRERALMPGESDLLAELLRRQEWRARAWRKREARMRARADALMEALARGAV